VELLLALGANPNVIDFSTLTESGTPLDYALSVGSYECALLMRKFGGFDAKELIMKSTATIAKFWRKHKRTTKPQHGKPMKEYHRGPLMRRLSHVPSAEPIIEVMHDSLEFSQIEPEKESNAVADKQPKVVQNATNLNRRHSTAGLILRRKSSFLESSDILSDKIHSATKIQKAWRRYCIKIETKYLIQVMGPEEASQMIARIMVKEREQESKRQMFDRARRKSRKFSDASKILYEFPSKANVDSRRSSFSFGRTDTNGLIPMISSDEASEYGTARRNSIMADFGRTESKLLTKNKSFISYVESENSSIAASSFLSPGNTFGAEKPLSRAPTVFKMTMSEDELEYLAQERERNEQEYSSKM
jgi:hypothetical protein